MLRIHAQAVVCIRNAGQTKIHVRPPNGSHSVLAPLAALLLLAAGCSDVADGLGQAAGSCRTCALGMGDVADSRGQAAGSCRAGALGMGVGADGRGQAAGSCCACVRAMDADAAAAVAHAADSRLLHRLLVSSLRLAEDQRLPMQLLLLRLQVIRLLLEILRGPPRRRLNECQRGLLLRQQSVLPLHPCLVGIRGRRERRQPVCLGPLMSLAEACLEKAKLCSSSSSSSGSEYIRMWYVAVAELAEAMVFTRSTKRIRRQYAPEASEFSA